MAYIARSKIEEMYRHFTDGFLNELKSDEFYDYFINAIRSGESNISIYEKYVERNIDLRWVEIIENTIIPLDNIIRTPMRFIKNDFDAISLESKYYNSCLKYLNDVRAYSRKRNVCVEHIKELSYLQHYGFNTRLLDITDDEDIALYFASCENFDNDGVIYSINDVEQRMSCDVQSVHRKIECIMNGEEIKGKKLKEYFNKNSSEMVENQKPTALS